MKKIFTMSIIAAIMSGIAMIITGLARGFGSMFTLDCTIGFFSISVFVVFLSYVVLKREKGKMK